jgi:hypothetical protein
MAGAISKIQLSPIPEKLHNLGRAFGLLVSVQAEEGCQIALIGSQAIALPEDIRLSEHIGRRIGVMRYGDRVLIRRLEQ